MFQLTVICRQPSDGPGEVNRCGHARHTRACCNVAKKGQPLPKGPNGEAHEHSVACCTHSCWSSSDCGTAVTYAPAVFGDERQCGATATFEGATLTDAEDQAVAANWRVDVPTRGEFTRQDVCPECNNGEPEYDEGEEVWLGPRDSYGSRTTFNPLQPIHTDTHAA